MALLGAAVQQIQGAQGTRKAKRGIERERLIRKAEGYGKDMSDLRLQDAYNAIDQQQEQGLGQSAVGAISSAIGSGGDLFPKDDPGEAQAWKSYQPAALDRIDEGNFPRLNEDDYRLLGGSGRGAQFEPVQSDPQGGFQLPEDMYPLLSGQPRRKHRFTL